MSKIPPNIPPNKLAFQTHHIKYFYRMFSSISFLLTTQQRISYCADHNQRENHVKLFIKQHTQGVLFQTYFK